jgi:hypothetical protein
MAQDRIHIVRLPHATLSAPIRIVPIDSESFQATASVLQRCKIPPMPDGVTSFPTVDASFPAEEGWFGGWYMPTGLLGAQ